MCAVRLLAVLSEWGVCLLRLWCVCFGVSGVYSGERRELLQKGCVIYETEQDLANKYKGKRPYFTRPAPLRFIHWKILCFIRFIYCPASLSLESNHFPCLRLIILRVVVFRFRFWIAESSLSLDCVFCSLGFADFFDMLFWVLNRVTNEFESCCALPWVARLFFSFTYVFCGVCVYNLSHGLFVGLE